MATINFVNNTLIAGTTANPGLEDVLSATGAITANTASLFEITNTGGGQFNGFRFQLTSSLADFTYIGTTPTGGTIDGIIVLAPDGVTHIIEVPDIGGPFADQDLDDFFAALTDPFEGPLEALDELLDSENTVNGSAIADHATTFGDEGSIVFGNGGDDVVWGRDFFFDTLVGGAGNDTLRVEDAFYAVAAGANLDGSGGAGETNTLEVSGNDSDFFSVVDFETITNITALRFVDTDPPVAPSILAAELAVAFAPDQIGNGLVSLTLAVDGSSTASPHSSNVIFVSADFDPDDTTPVNLNLSGWTFANWSQESSWIDIETNEAVALDDIIVGSAVSDLIETFAGNDRIQGGGGVDELFGGDGNDTFVFAAGEAVAEEFVDGGGPDDTGGTTDTVLLQGTNNFTGVAFEGIEQLAFGGAKKATFDQGFIDNPSAKVIGDANANALVFQLVRAGHNPQIDLSQLSFEAWRARSDTISILGTKVHDSLVGSSRNDLLDGNGGSDFLQGGRGNDVFLFDTPFRRGVDHIVDFGGDTHPPGESHFLRAAAWPAGGIGLRLRRQRVGLLRPHHLRARHRDNPLRRRRHR